MVAAVEEPLVAAAADSRKPTRRRVSQGNSRASAETWQGKRRSSLDSSAPSAPPGPGESEAGAEAEPGPPTGWRDCGKDALAGIHFQSGLALVIVFNSVVVGLETDFPHLGCWTVVEDALLVIFAVELALRLVVIGPVESSSTDNVVTLQTKLLPGRGQCNRGV